MIQRVTILLKSTTAETVSVESDLVLTNGYLAYSETIGGNVVNDLNVKDFLDNPSNEEIATDFFNFLQTNTTTDEFRAIFYNSQKLSNTFNDFYNKTIRTGQKPSRKDVTPQLTGSTAHTFSSVDFVTPTERSKNNTSLISFINTGQSYYLPVFIDTQFDRVETSDLDRFHHDCLGDEQVTLETAYNRFIEKRTVLLPNPENLVKEYQSFVGVSIGKGNLTAFKFKFDKKVVGLNEIVGIIPVDIIFQNPVPSAQTIYMLVSTSASTAVFGTDFDLNNPLIPSKTYKKFPLNAGDTGITTDIRVFDSFKSNPLAKITLFLSSVVLGDTGGRGPDILIVPDMRRFEVINEQPLVQSEVMSDVNEVEISKVSQRQNLLQCFVDENFNDSESEFWRNRNVTISNGLV